MLHASPVRENLASVLCYIVSSATSCPLLHRVLCYIVSSATSCPLLHRVLCYIVSSATSCPLLHRVLCYIVSSATSCPLLHRVLCYIVSSATSCPLLHRVLCYIVSVWSSGGSRIWILGGLSGPTGGGLILPAGGMVRSRNEALLGVQGSNIANFQRCLSCSTGFWDLYGQLIEKQKKPFFWLLSDESWPMWGLGLSDGGLNPPAPSGAATGVKAYPCKISMLPV